MKRVLLLGDSIRMGYDKYVREMLQNKCEVLYDEADNGRFAAYTLWQTNQMFKRYGSFDIVHWNNGYWDMNIEAPMREPIHPLEEYVHFLKRIIKQIRSHGARIIFATTTPVPEKGISRDNSGLIAEICYDNAWVEAYNAAAKKLMVEEAIPVNDLYALCRKSETFYKGPDGLHLSEVGYRVCATQTAAMIEKML